MAKLFKKGEKINYLVGKGSANGTVISYDAATDRVQIKTESGVVLSRSSAKVAHDHKNEKPVETEMLAQEAVKEQRLADPFSDEEKPYHTKQAIS